MGKPERQGSLGTLPAKKPSTYVRQAVDSQSSDENSQGDVFPKLEPPEPNALCQRGSHPSTTSAVGLCPDRKRRLALRKVGGHLKRGRPRKGTRKWARRAPKPKTEDSKMEMVIKFANRRKNLYLKLLALKKCRVCRQLQEEDWTETLLCSVCDDAYHLSCLPVKLTQEQARAMDEWFCPQCQEKSLPVNSLMEEQQLPSYEHLKSEEFPDDYSLYVDMVGYVICQIKNYLRLGDLDKVHWTRRQGQSFRLRPFVPIGEKQLYWIPLIRALAETNHLFCPYQVYKDQETMELNRSLRHLPSTAEMLSTKDERAFEEFDRLIGQGEAPPITVERCPLKGFLIRAVEEIPTKTIISEYGGEVMRYRESLGLAGNDSIFTLLETGNSSTSLDIVPKEFANISKYFLGINNDRLEQYLRINVQSILFSYRGRNRIIFYTLRKIGRGEPLYINYNGGITHHYPTHDFK